MPTKPMSISDEDYKKVKEAIEAVMHDGKEIRSIFESYYDGDPDISVSYKHLRDHETV